MQSRPITRQEWVDALAPYDAEEIQVQARRRAPRAAVNTSATIRYADPGNGSPTEVFCGVLGLSNTGLMLRSRSEISPQTTMSIEIYLGDDAFELHGRVAHCTQTVGAFKVGIELEFDE